ncbi:MAG TPA: serine hydrolase domain-containing protein [Planctomycetota bacterium]
MYPAAVRIPLRPSALFLAALACGAGSCALDRTLAPPGEALEALEATLRAETGSGSIPSVAFAIVKDGRVLRENAFGWADKEARIASSVHTPYPLASATKPIVATAVMILQERGLIDLDAPAPASPGAAPPEYRVRQLLNHTSGLPTYASIHWRDQDRPARSLEQTLGKYGFAAQPPGTIFEYSNLGYGLLGRIVERQSGSSLAEFLEAEVFGPLGMHDSSLVDSDSDFDLAPAGAAVKYAADGKRLVGTCNDTPGAGSAYASAHDLALFGAFHLSDDPVATAPILRAESKRGMRRFVEPGASFSYYDGARYGLGWYFRTTAAGEPVVWHEGGMPGASAILVLLPKRGVAVAVVINATDANAKAQTFANSLIQAVEPGFPALAFDATAGLDRYTDQAEFLGRWEGTIAIDGPELPWALDFDPGGTIRATVPGRTEGDRLPPVATFGAFVKGPLLVATLAATLPSADVDQTSDGYVLLRLVRRGDQLSGAAIAYAAPSRLEHLYPFAARLRRVPE